MFLGWQSRVFCGEQSCGAGGSLPRDGAGMLVPYRGFSIAGFPGFCEERQLRAGADGSDLPSPSSHQVPVRPRQQTRERLLLRGQRSCWLNPSPHEPLLALGSAQGPDNSLELIKSTWVKLEGRGGRDFKKSKDSKAVSQVKRCHCSNNSFPWVNWSANSDWSHCM